MTERCTCRVCEPAPIDDEHEQKILHDVQTHYVHIIWVPAGDAVDEPVFAYTVGLWHQDRHPELLMSGQKPELMHRALNEAVGWVRAGQRLTPGMAVEGVIGGFPVAVEALTPEAVDETATYSGWFHRRRVDVVQLVWTDLDGVWPWQPGAHELTRERQPESWRVPSSRTGALATDPAWVMPTPADTLVFSCVHVVEEGAVVSHVTRERDPKRGEDWQILCDGQHAELTAEDIRLVHLAHMVRAAPSLRDLQDLDLDECADRPNPWEPWQRSALIAEQPQKSSGPPPRRRWFRR